MIPPCIKRHKVGISLMFALFVNCWPLGVTKTQHKCKEQVKIYWNSKYRCRFLPSICKIRTNNLCSRSTLSYFDSDSSLIAKVVSSRGVIILIFWLYSRVKVVLVSQQIQLVTLYAACHFSILSQMKHFQRPTKTGSLKDNNKKSNLEKFKGHIR